MKKLIAITLASFSVSLWAQTDLTKKLDDLRVPDDKVTPVISKDKLFLVNTRYSSLTNRHELSFSGANNFTAVSHLDTKQMGLQYRYHLNPRWNFGLKYNNYFNELTDAGDKLYQDEKILPDTDYALKSTSLFAGFNTLYGKMRWAADSVIYFDQYIALGYGDIDLARGMQKFAHIDIGFAFWIKKHMSARIGVNNEFYTQRQINGTKDVQNMMGYLEFGYLFGEGNI